MMALRLLLVLLLAAPALRPGPAAAAGSELVVLLEAEPKTLDPVFATDANGVHISHQLVFETLLRLNDQLEVVPGLARTVQRLSPTRYALALPPGVVFHDGSPLDAGDVAWTLETLMAPRTGSPYGSVLRDKVAAVRVTGPLAVEIDLRGPYASFLSDLIVPVRSRRAGAARPLAGTGPFRFGSSAVGEIVLDRNERYRGARAGVERIVFKVVRDESTRLLKLRKGEIDLALNVVPLEKVAGFLRKPLSTRYRVEEAPGLTYQYLGFNLADAMLGNVKVRRALAHAIDVAALIRHRQHGHSTRATGLMPPGSPFHAPGLEPPAYDSALAGRLLDEAGYPLAGGRRFGLTYKTSTDRSAIFQARVIQSDLAKVGVTVDVRSYEWATFYDDIQKGNFQLFSLRWIGVSDPDFYYELFHSTRLPPAGRNRVRYRNPALDRLLEAGRAEADPARRRELYHRVERLLAEDLPYLSLWHTNNIAIVSRALAGFRLHPAGDFQALARVRKGSP
ncbi:MAG: ABC transporter substrate-binding protein [Candidatus Lambdaproteobacteria bacterium]|nr:ABC transporter substrate-binding protein [Candidatus Lambdaproteobacteria bacterium]